jgi:HSP90 family molecular chaperone
MSRVKSCSSRGRGAIRNASVKRVLALLEDLAEHHQEKYATFWKQFGRVLREGPPEDPSNRSHRTPAAFCVDACGHRRADGLAGATTSAG